MHTPSVSPPANGTVLVSSEPWRLWPVLYLRGGTLRDAQETLREGGLPHSSAQLCVQRCRVGSLKSSVARVFTPRDQEMLPSRAALFPPGGLVISAPLITRKIHFSFPIIMGRDRNKVGKKQLTPTGSHTCWRQPRNNVQTHTRTWQFITQGTEVLFHWRLLFKNMDTVKFLLIFKLESSWTNQRRANKLFFDIVYSLDSKPFSSIYLEKRKAKI